ncbi:similar to An13g01050 [Aspergillus luchuensis]|nr:similar to An13g01050 [Aspergillus luchuensis]
MDAAALLCNICPKRPTFSDVSHLLTHISSKAHLSHYFKLQVRSHQEQQAVVLLHEYDRWYKRNNLAKLLSDRMSSKEARKKKIHEKSYTESETDNATVPVSTASPSFQNPLFDYLDPRLSRSYVIAEPETEDTNTPYSSANAASCDPSYNLTHTYPGLEDHSLAPITSPTKTLQALCSPWKQEPLQRAEDEDVPVQTALYWAKASDNEADVAPQPSDQYSCDPFVDDNETESIYFPTINEMEKERADEIARLKGVLWPGMDIFDSATEQMRRRRNQKKDESILKLMEKTSLCVEPTELVFSPTGILRKQRVISGNVEDSSPLKGETPVPKRRVNRPKRALSQVDPNIQRGQSRKRTRRTTKRIEKLVDRDTRGRDTQIPKGSLGPQRLHRYGSRGDDMDEFELSFRGTKLKPRTGFTVFHDRPSQCNVGSTDHKHGDDGTHAVASAPSHPLYLLKDFTLHHDAYPLSPGDQSTAVAGRAHDMTKDKENIEPLLDVRGRIDPLMDWQSPSLTEHLTSGICYPPQYFFRDPRPVGFRSFDNQESPTGYSFNPLAVSLSGLPADDGPMYTPEPELRSNNQYEPQLGSPESTISDVDESEFGRLYLDGSSF